MQRYVAKILFPVFVNNRHLLFMVNILPSCLYHHSQIVFSVVTFVPSSLYGIMLVIFYVEREDVDIVKTLTQPQLNLTLRNLGLVLQ